ncbi:zinc ribbon domain-containing protein [Aquiflexum gelatinilyticum]|jgi:predicted  nucleic acid-binding Zn-ribbon protein|uniref:C4-type zinc ribbon domain-containing protein n=1 Tax=Aquiflexum gelatinilyticum TaxID=2961943 RepID=A0A9X2P4Z8_9BACT|nr:C4-type zinc ribbon domain-containing protein [Aquiflexum gelatinilyticum]MCR9013725.1 C4-type zinc ribbon domain-containing protein [Aquiflexum gelatinilyticum]
MESTVAQKLEALLNLQKIDSRLDSIFKVRGALPEEVQDLEDEIAGYETRLQKFHTDTVALEEDIKRFKDNIKESEKLIKKYQEQQMNVRNNREYDAITKELELQDLEIQVSKKKIGEAQAKIEFKNNEVNELQEILKERQKDLNNKKDELGTIVSESENDESKLKSEREKAIKKIEDRLVKSYTKIRTNAKNGLAVVMVKRGACGGCFNVVPPQRQADIREKKKIIVCEHCGRVFAGVEDEIEEEGLKKKRSRA